MNEGAEGVQTQKRKSCSHIAKNMYLLLQRKPVDQSLKYIFNLM